MKVAVWVKEGFRGALVRPIHFLPTRYLMLAFCIAVPLAVDAADVTWTGPANGQWHVGSNWSGGTVPLPADNVTISSGNVSVSDARQIDGTLTVTAGAVLSVAGSGGSFVATGPTIINNGRFSVGGGALLDLSNATEYIWDLCADQSMLFVDGANSVLDLSGVQSMIINVPSCEGFAGDIFVGNGGLLDLTGLESIAAPGEQGLAFALVLDGMIDAPNLMAIEGPDAELMLAISFLVSASTSLDLPALEVLSNASLSVTDGQISANALTEADACIISAAGDDTLSLDSLATLTHSALFVPTTARMTLPELTFLSDTFVLMSSDSVLTVPKLAAIEGTTKATTFTAAGQVTLNAPQLVTARNVAFAANALGGVGSELDLSSLRTYTWDICEGGVPFTAGGAGTVLNVSGLRSLSITNAGCLGLGYPTAANTGARIDLSDLATIATPVGQFVSFLSANAGTVIDLSALTSFNPVSVSFFEQDGGQIIRNGGGGGEGEGEGEGEGKMPGCSASSGSSIGVWGPGDTVLILGLLVAIGLGSRRKARSGMDRDN